MARWESWSWSWSLMLSLLLSLSAHGELSLTTVSKTEVQHSQSSFSAVERAVLIGDDSAELIGLGLGLAAGLPLSAIKRKPSHRRHSHLDFTEQDDQPIREELTGEESQERSDDIIKVEFHNPDRPLTPDLSSDSDWLTAVVQPLQQRAGDPTAWTLSDFYDYLSPDDELSTIDSTLDPDPTLTPPTDMEDENPSLTGSPVLNVTPDNDDPQPPSQSQSPPPPSPPQGSDGCGLGFVRSEVGGECVSQCDTQPDFCYNRGVCTIATGIGAFCRCNVQDYMWNKGSRCDWVVTDFQVLCVVVGVASTTLILLIIIIVFFAKRLHRLRIENRRLRKRSLYRPHSEMQTDGFSVSTAQDGSHANVRKLCDSPPPPPQPHAHNLAYYDNIICQDDPQKMEDPVKSQFTQGEESLNIANSHSPKYINNRPAHSSDHTPNADQEVNREEASSSPSNNIY
ncbi:chondroitin sulfate proteoglycan 5-like isoform X1 [Salvelinus alpinus]|uniref:chondroitin sulfate proteoglycan 5-like isoform X1 n=1 Tax=Salvelinus alpinus TaxID=8036 RepID=UPI0039FD291B